jgi:hypothetical protein
LASESIENLEIESIRAEAAQLLCLFGDDDAADLIQDLDTAYADYHGEIYAVISGIVDYRSRSFNYEPEAKDRCNRFFGFCAGIACDGRLKVNDVEKLIGMIDQDTEFLDDPRMSGLRKAAAEAISDRHLSADEEKDFSEWIARLVGDSCADTGLPTYGNTPSIDGVLRDPAKLVFENAGSW